MRSLVLASLCVLAACSRSELDRRVIPQHEASTPAPTPNYPERRAELKARGEAATGQERLLFVGDSITQGWEREGAEVWAQRYGAFNAMNMGVGGDRTQDVLARLEEGQFAKLKPELIVLMIGTNNTGRTKEAPAKIADGVAAILKQFRARMPDAKILLLAIFPRGKAPADELRMNNIAANELIARLADGEDIRYLDIGKSFLDADGTLPEAIMPDLLHLSPDGYRRWADAIQPVVDEVLGAKK